MITMNIIDKAFNRLSWLTPWFKGRSLMRFLVVFMITLVITLLCPPATGQFMIPSFSGNTPETYQTPWWDINKARPCGRVWCSDVLLFRSFKIIEVAAESSSLQEESPVILAEQRAQQVDNIYRSILDKVLRSKITTEDKSIDTNLETKMGGLDIIFNINQLGLHPATPNVEVGFKNNVTVVFVPKQLELGLPAQTIVSVLPADRLNQGKSIPEIAQEWRNTIRKSFSYALWGYEIDEHYPFLRLALAVLFLVLILLPIGLIGIIRHLLKNWNRHLQNQLRELRESLTIDAESLSAEQVNIDVQGEVSEEEIIESQKKQRELNFARIKYLLKKAITNPKKAIEKAKEIMNTTVQTLSTNIPKLSLKQQGIVKRQQNIVQLLLRLLFWLQIFLLLLDFALIVALFPNLRPFAFFFIGQAIFLPLIWMLMSILDKISDLMIDSWLNKWASEAQLSNPNSNRYALRVSTYSPALRSATTFIFTVLGIVLTIMLFGFDPTVLASVGGVAFVIAFISRNIVEDMLNGALILCTDRYAIGDIIQVGGLSGFVENMNIYITQVRGAEGRLITIPNSKISIVENLTKDWSRVEFKIEIAYDADIHKALTVIREVGEAMQKEDDWKNKIIEPPAILGVDAVSHQGILIQVWIKTQAMQQWAVGREYRLRVKDALEKAQIKLGIPQREIRYQKS